MNRIEFIKKLCLWLVKTYIDNNRKMDERIQNRAESRSLDNSRIGKNRS